MTMFLKIIINKLNELHYFLLMADTKPSSIHLNKIMDDVQSSVLALLVNLLLVLVSPIRPFFSNLLYSYLNIFIITVSMNWYTDEVRLSRINHRNMIGRGACARPILRSRRGVIRRCCGGSSPGCGGGKNSSCIGILRGPRC